ncbi:MAG: sterol desaturase family protein [Pseudomonadales bacterium]
MEFMTKTFTPDTIYMWDQLLNDYFFVAATAFLLFELVRYAVKRRLSWNLLGDTVTNYVTLAMFLGIGFLIGAAYIAAFYVVYEFFSLWTAPINGWSILLCIVLADVAYYCEHRFMHRVGLAWATHTVHHSSPHFNISVAYRFGPLDSIFPIFFHLPLAMLGFHPILIFFAEIVVQLYQTVLHTEAVGKLPRPVEAVMNTPSHHRVHHGSNPEYLDKNYAGIFIVWDKLFGTFAEEQATVTYGLVKPVDSVNPLTVFFHGIGRLYHKLRSADSFSAAVGYLTRPPDWTPKSSVATTADSATGRQR